MTALLRTTSLLVLSSLLLLASACQPRQAPIGVSNTLPAPDVVTRTNTPALTDFTDEAPSISALDTATATSSENNLTAMGGFTMVSQKGVGKATAISLRHDQTKLAIATAAGAVQIFSYPDMGLDVTLQEPIPNRIRALSWSPDGNAFAFGTDSGNVIVWDATEEKVISRTPQHSDYVLGIEWTSDSQRFATFDEDAVAIWTAAGDLVQVLDDVESVTDIAWSPDGSQLVSVTYDNIATVWDITTAQIAAQYTGLEDVSMQRVMWLPAANQIAIVSSTLWLPDLSPLQLWDIQTNSIVGSWGDTKESITDIGWDTKTQSIVVFGNKIYLLEPQTLAAREQKSYTQPLNGPIQLIPQTMLATYIDVSMSEALVVNIDTGQPTVSKFTGFDEVNALAWAHSGTQLYIGGNAATIGRISTKNSDSIEYLAWAPHPVKALAAYQDERVAIVGDQGLISVIEPKTQQATAFLEDTSEWFSDVEWAPNGSMIAVTATDGQLFVWDWPALTLRYQVEAPAGFVTDVSWSADSSQLAVTGWENVVSIWNAETGEQVGQLPKFTHYGPTTVAWSPVDQLTIAVGSYGGLTIVDAFSQAALHQLRGIGDSEIITSLAWSPNGKFLAAGTDSEPLRIWETTNWELVELSEAPTQVLALHWTKDSQTLAAGTDTGQVWIFNQRP